MKEIKEIKIQQREKRANAIAAMGLVNRRGDYFEVSTPSLRGRQNAFQVGRDDSGVVICSCSEFQGAAAVGEPIRCEHILAVKFALTKKNTEPSVKEVRPAEMPAEEPVSIRNTTTESRKSGRGEQNAETISTDVSVTGQAETTNVKEVRLEDTQGDKKVKRDNLKEVSVERDAEVTENEQNRDNVLDFSTTLKELRKHVDPNLVKQREGWRDRNGNVQMVDYVEWHTVADILDENAPNWTHTVKDIRQIGDIMTVTVAITIDGITREGIGTGLAQNEMGIKKAEHDALKRAAVKFGIARDLYKKESDVIERAGSPNGDDDFPTNPVASSLSSLVTAKQLGMIRAIAREIGVDPDEECQSVMNCATDELSKRAASALIQHLQELQKQGDSAAKQPLRRAS